MAIRLCAHNHYYDDEKYAVCPICLRAAQDGAPDATLTVGQGEETAAYGPLQEDPAARPVVGVAGLCRRGGAGPRLAAERWPQRHRHRRPRRHPAAAGRRPR